MDDNLPTTIAAGGRTATNRCIRFLAFSRPVTVAVVSRCEPVTDGYIIRTSPQYFEYGYIEVWIILGHKPSVLFLQGAELHTSP